MSPPTTSRWVRNLDVGRLLERFLVAGATAFLAIRIYLALTNYPQIGGHGLHIAHMLWGGLLMLVAVVILVSFLGGRVRALGAVLGGIGFGTFIDELGKFITSDNNYFFQPTVAIIYLIFIGLFLAFQAIDNFPLGSERARLAQGLDAFVTAVVAGYGVKERDRALAAFAAVPHDPIARDLAAAIVVVPPIPADTGSVIERLTRQVTAFYRGIVESRQFFWIAVALMAAQALVGIAGVVIEVVSDPAFSRSNLNLSLGDVIKGGANLIGNVFVVVGLLRLRKSRLAALRWFKRAIMVTIFVVQLFSFYDAGVRAAVGLVTNLILLAVVNFALAEETTASV